MGACGWRADHWINPPTPASGILCPEAWCRPARTPHPPYCASPRGKAGLAPVELAAHSPLRTVLRMHRRLPDGYQVETVHLSDCVLDAATAPASLDGEVMEFRCVDMGVLRDMITHGAFTLEAELCILDSLQHRLSAGQTAVLFSG